MNQNYWEKKNELTSTPFFSSVFPRNRFMEILRYFHLSNNNDTDSNGRLVKFGNILSQLLSNFSNAVKPGRDLCIDESLVKFKGRLSFKMYIPSKRSRFGIKVHTYIKEILRIYIQHKQ